MGDDSSRWRRRGDPPPAGEDGEDRISHLPDELLHDILVCLGSTRAAAQTSVLSRRWRRVWKPLPELFLSEGKGAAAASFLDTVDAALAASSAPTLRRLRISAPYPYQLDGPSVPAHRAAPWLHLASQRVAGDIFLNLGPDDTSFFDMETTDDAGEEEEGALELPACVAATSITLEASVKVRLAGGVFTALTELVLQNTRLDGRELSDLVSAQCPRLRKLELLVVLVAASDVTIHSNSLHSLYFFVRNTQRLEVVAPKLEDLSISCFGMPTYISAPSLANVTWSDDAYDPSQHQFAHIHRRLRLLNLEITAMITPLMLMEQFNEVDELRVCIDIQEGIAGYECFLNLTNKLPKCETIGICLEYNEHRLAPTILHLFRACNSVKKLSIELLTTNLYCHRSRYSCPLACPCRLEEGSMNDDFALGSLGEVEIDCFEGSHDEMEFVQQLSICNTPVLQKLVINYSTTYPPPPLTKEVCEKVRSMCRPNLKVEFYAVSKGRRVPFD